MERDYANFLVGGMSYCLLLEEIRTYPESYFNAVIKKEWNPELEMPIKIDRDGMMFRYIVEFHHHGELPFKSKKVSLDVVRQIQAEADFYNLPLLVQACEKYAISRISSYLHNRGITCEYQHDDPNKLVNVVSAVWAPFCINGFKTFYRDCTIIKSSTIKALNVDELCELAAPAPFGKGSETLIDKSVRDALEISADQLNQELWQMFHSGTYSLHELAPRMNLELRPYKLVIYREGGHFTEHRDSVRGENHVGTLVHILNSDFTGGELVVRQNDTEVSISRPGEWIAMYGDALHRIEPVTSGTRVALIFDLYNECMVTDYDFFDDMERFEDPAADENCIRAVNDTTRDKIYTALDKELNKYEEVVICLTHLYPMCQADPACLKGGDLVLYQLLAERGNMYEVSIVPVKVNASIDYKERSSSYLSGDVVDLDYELTKECFGRKHASALLVIPLQCTSNHVLSYSEFIEHVGNQPQAEETMYLVTGFCISKRAAPASEEPTNEAVGQK